jgi:hypothetical protein
MTAADEAILNEHYEQKGWGRPLEIVMYDRVPGMYKAMFADGAEHGVLHGGKLLEDKGLGAAGAYMRDVQLLTRAPETHELIALLDIFGALPPIAPSGYAAPDQFYDHDRHPELNPILEFGAGGGALILNYLLPHRGEPTPDADLRTVMQWTLAIPPSYELAWSEEETTFDVSAS